MNGHFELSLRDSGDLRDADFRAARREGLEDDLLHNLPEVLSAAGENQVTDNFASYAFVNLFSGGAVAAPYGNGGAAAAALSLMCLSSYTDAPTYTDESDDYQSWYGSVGGCIAAKLFVEEIIETPLLVCAPTPLESMSYRSRWLFLPSEAVSASIASVAVFFSEDGDNTGWSHRGRMARIRLKNQAGLPLLINKTARHVLLVEYVFTLVTV